MDYLTHELSAAQQAQVVALAYYTANRTLTPNTTAGRMALIIDGLLGEIDARFVELQRPAAYALAIKTFIEHVKNINWAKKSLTP